MADAFRVSAFLLALLPAVARSQPIGAAFATIESKVAAADQVVLAKIGDLQVERIGPEKIRHYTVTLKVQEVLKGPAAELIKGLEPVRIWGPYNRFDAWKEAHRTLLCFIDTKPRPGSNGRAWDFHRLGELTPADNHFKQYPIVPTFDRHLGIVKTEAAIVALARRYAQETKNTRPIASQRRISIRVPYETCKGMPTGAWNDVILPIDPSLEKLARRLIRTPEQFLPDDFSRETQAGLHARHVLRKSGIQCLRFFPSESNAVLLRSIFPQPLAPFESEDNMKPLRILALETLLGWGEAQNAPAFASKIKRLEVYSPVMSDSSLELVAKMDALESLRLSESQVTSSGIKKLGKLKHITMLELRTQQLTDGVVKTLREIGMLHAISVATTLKDQRRPTVPSDVSSLALYQSRLTPEGLRQFQDFDSVTYLDLRGTPTAGASIQAVAHMKLEWLHLEATSITDDDLPVISQFKTLRILGLGGLPITDDGLRHLKDMRQLTHIRLGGTKVTEAGIQQFRDMLPNCKILLHAPN